MTHRVTVTVNDGESMIERVYEYEVSFADKVPLEQVEAHLKNMARMLDQQAAADTDEDDESWRAGGETQA
jgi:hypothetical protein